MWFILILVLLLAILLPSLARAREIAKRAVCAANQRALGQCFRVYSNENRDWWPAHPFAVAPLEDAAAEPGPPPGRHSVRWVGTMGSNDFLKISENSTKSPERNHPSRALFLLVINGSATSRTFVCPSSRDIEDLMRNHGPDAPAQRSPVACNPGVTRFDFVGYHTLSYGYQLPFGPRARPHENLDPRMAMLADKGPYYEAGGPGLEGTETTRDQRSAVNPPAEASAGGTGDEIRAKPDRFWRPYNSRNHHGEGQNVLFVDSHVEFVKRPIVGVNYDNIYTLQSGLSLAGSVLGMVPGPDEPLGPGTQTDSFIVP
ncbi:MAG: hypothetical protein AB1716_19570 [Planctomycetota bacterium]